MADSSQSVPTWCPFRLQLYFNGHNRLATALDKAGVEYQLVDNAFVAIDDFNKAQKLADGLDVRELHSLLDRYARKCCPVIKQLGVGYHWSAGAAISCQLSAIRRYVRSADG
jgi:hypothetical protein